MTAETDTNRNIQTPSVRADKVYLVGFMAAGKSSLAHALGERLKWRVEDMDGRIEAREHMTITEIFRRRGEPYFRTVERAVLAEVLPLQHTVVATGGGRRAPHKRVGPPHCVAAIPGVYGTDPRRCTAHKNNVTN